MGGRKEVAPKSSQGLQCSYHACTRIIYTVFWKPHTNCVKWMNGRLNERGWGSLSHYLKVAQVGGSRARIMSPVCVTLNPVCSLLCNEHCGENKLSYWGWNEMESVLRLAQSKGRGDAEQWCLSKYGPGSLASGSSQKLLEMKSRKNPRSCHFRLWNQHP